MGASSIYRHVQSKEELFAEALAFNFTKRKLPEAVTKLVEATLSYAKANS